MEPLNVLMTEFYPKDNSTENHTEEYDLVNNKDIATPVLRRGENFFFAIRFDRPFEEDGDAVRVRFSIGKCQVFLQEISALVLNCFRSQSQCWERDQGHPPNFASKR